MPRTFYADTLTVSANTTWAAPAELLFAIPAGTIVEWYIQGAPEHQHQVSMAAYHLEHRIFPEGEMEYFYPGEIPAVFRVQSEMTPGIRLVAIRAANEDDTFPHSVYVGITVETDLNLEALLRRFFGLIMPRYALED